MAERKGLKKTIAATLGVSAGILGYSILHPKITFGEQTSNQSDHTSVVGAFVGSPEWTATPSITLSATPTPSETSSIQPTVDAVVSLPTSTTTPTTTPTSDREMPNPDMDNPTSTLPSDFSATQTQSYEDVASTFIAMTTATPTPSATETERLVGDIVNIHLSQDDIDSWQAQKLIPDSVVPHGLPETLAKAAGFLVLQYNGTGNLDAMGIPTDLQSDLLQRAATANNVIRNEFGVQGQIDESTLRISDIDSNLDALVGEGFTLVEEKQITASSLDGKRKFVMLNITPIDPNTRFSQTAVRDWNTQLAYPYNNAPLEEGENLFRIVTFVSKDGNWGIETIADIRQACGNEIIQGRPLPTATPGEASTPIDTATPIYIQTPTSSYTPPVITETSTPMLTLTNAPTNTETIPTATQYVPTSTPFIPSSTPAPTNTHEIPTATQYIPTNTAVPQPTNTEVPPATNTSVPPTAPRPTAAPTNEDIIPTAIQS